MARKVILDVDAGSDDACAIMLAYLHKDIDLIAVCSVKGNQPLKNTNENTLRIRQLLGADFPVYKGCRTGLVSELIVPKIPRAKNVTAYDENGNVIQFHKELFDLPESVRKEEDMPAPLFYVDYLRKAKEPVTVVTVGPMTNLAVALLIDPDIVKNIEEIVIMGGGHHITNVTNAAEFNVYDDPEAAQRVLHCGVKITMVPLDATHTAYIGKDTSAKLREINTPASIFAADLIDVRILVHNQCQPLEVPDTCALHDPLTIAYLVDPEVLQDVFYTNVEVSTYGMTVGQTVVDNRAIQEHRNVHFAYRGNPIKFAKIFTEAFEQSR